METIVCKECHQEISYQSSANFIIFCPKCLNYTFMECEYGYGPVVPCFICLGDKQIGMVTQDDARAYVLQYSGKTVPLKKRYLEALKEAVEVIKREMKRGASD